MTCLAAGITEPSRHTVIAGRRLCGGVTRSDRPSLNDARKIDRQTLLDYAEHLRRQVDQGELAIATAQNRLPSVNRPLAALRGVKMMLSLSLPLQLKGHTILI
jgi:hypothetical protein